MPILPALLLGFVQGLTEFIPVSSTAHLLLVQTWLGLPSGDLMFAFLVIIQLGTVASLIALFWKDLWAIARAMLNIRTPTPERSRGLYIIIATLPAAAMGYVLRHAIEALFTRPLTEAAVRLYTAAFLLILAEFFGRRLRQLESMNWLDALVIGLFQVISVFPGASRSATTIAGGMLRGFDRPAAARFAFLMSVPIMLGAGGYQLVDVMGLPQLGQFLPAIGAGFLTAAVVGWFSIKWLLGYFSHHSLYVFAVYCALLGTLALLAL